jgi:agmatine deiminase
MSETPFYLPPEWAPQAAVWVGWPHLRGEWGDAFDGARAEIAGFINAIAKVTPVRIACGSREAYGSAWNQFQPLIRGGQVALHPLPAGDIWLRDTGPLIGFQGRERQALSFQFNGWGGKFQMSGDTMTAGGIASVERLPRRAHEFILEGGAVDLDGAGTLLTTRQCLLNPNRNADWTEKAAETALRAAFNIEDILWLEDGLLNDHTDGHIDNIARFIGSRHVLCQRPFGEDDPNAATLTAIEASLRGFGLRVDTLPSPGRITDSDGEPVPASHMNFLISNQTVFLPTYEPRSARLALRALKDLLPDYEIIDLPARHILAGGGAFHCMTQQVPAFEEQSA